ncbi:MAG: SUMF1/EgtB/PvdO family nonheme iron enzyme, partial [Desulfobulbaceae bacterium]|nr:SUMF1/EgtB/PvdO family nonheme iron enzyme [Desulfobulbaceae bacterium]
RMGIRLPCWPWNGGLVRGGGGGGGGVNEKINGQYPWWTANSGGATHRVGTKAPNDFGLYDMLGNVWELCNDSDLYLTCGGSWGSEAMYVHPAARYTIQPDRRDDFLGFRVACSAKADGAMEGRD